MCGFTGYLSMSMGGERGRAFLEKGCALLRHRGPDEYSVNQNGHTGTGFARLSILDLETGMQPIADRESGASIICNGQIYNYIELKSQLPSMEYSTTGDMEVALKAYLNWGTGFAEKLNGMFAGAILDPSRKRIILFRDRFGIKPLYYMNNPNGFFFASEISPLLEAPGAARELNSKMLPSWFTYRYVFGEETMFRGIRKLLPGSMLVLDMETGDFRTFTYWNWEFRGNHAGTMEEAEEEFNALFMDAVRIRLRSDVEVGSLISGGIDSSAVASAAALCQPDLKLFTIGFHERDYDETSDVDRLLELMPGRFARSGVIRGTCLPGDLELLPDLVRSVEEPISLGTMVPTDQVCRLASERLKVVLTGEGADEVFAGYRKFLVEAAAIEAERCSPEGRRILLRDFPELSERKSVPGDHLTRHITDERLFQPDEIVGLTGISPGGFSDCGEKRLLSIGEGVDPIGAMQMIEALTRLPNYVNLRLDKLSMRHSLETRTPFLDYRLAEFAGRLPLDYRVNLEERTGKFLCREAFRKGGILPAEVTRRSKKPFTMPIAQWFSDPRSLPEPVADILLGNTVRAQGILNPDMVRAYAGEVTGTGVGPETLVSAGDRVFAIVVFSLWYGEFMKGTI
ncbi:MAG TPA: asparagine synthase (glutamine-hydrolyzing) [Candidatus Sabulitectum sp.]|nr:asparagine synthase (glutamine-hydrolyzing) [Candidatus Sabulitectum sp.]